MFCAAFLAHSEECTWRLMRREYPSPPPATREQAKGVVDPPQVDQPTLTQMQQHRSTAFLPLKQHPPWRGNPPPPTIERQPRPHARPLHQPSLTQLQAHRATSLLPYHPAQLPSCPAPNLCPHSRTLRRILYFHCKGGPSLFFAVFKGTRNHGCCDTLGPNAPSLWHVHLQIYVPFGCLVFCMCLGAS